MTEITRVPLQPLARGSKSKLWLGVIVAVAVGGAAAGALRPALVDVKTIKAGEGPNPTAGDVILVDYVGRLPNGTVFDQNKGVPMQMQGVIPGFAKALAQTQRGGHYLIKIPAKLAYGEKGAGGGVIPPNTDISFDLTVIDFQNRQVLEMRRQMMEQAMRQQQGAGQQGAAPQGAPAGE